MALDSLGSQLMVSMIPKPCYRSPAEPSALSPLLTHFSDTRFVNSIVQDFNFLAVEGYTTRIGRVLKDRVCPQLLQRKSSSITRPMRIRPHSVGWSGHRLHTVTYCKELNTFWKEREKEKFSEVMNFLNLLLLARLEITRSNVPMSPWTLEEESLRTQLLSCSFSLSLQRHQVAYNFFF